MFTLSPATMIKQNTVQTGVTNYTKVHKHLKMVKIRKKAKIRNRYNPIPHLTQDTIPESDKNTRKHQIQENQEVSPFPAGDHKVARNRQDSMTDKYETHKAKKIHKTSTTLERSLRKLLEDFYMLDGTNLTLIFDVDQDK